MNIIKTIICLTVVLGMAIPAFADDIIIPENIAQKIDSHAKAAKKSVPVKKADEEQNKTLFRTWVSGSIDFSKATKRVSDLFNRTSYHQNVKTMKLRLPGERIKKSDKGEHQLQLMNVQTLGIEKGVDLIYREGPGYQKYQVVKEFTAKKKIPKDKAMQLAQKFLEDNGFLKQSAKDKIATVYVQERRMNEEGQENPSNKPVDSLLQQDVVFERSYDGKPVINSKIVVGFLPDTKEIVNFKHYNWTPIEETQEKTLNTQELTGKGAPLSGDEIKNRLKQKIQSITGKATKSNVKEVIPAWFQTPDGLVPVLAFSVGVDYQDKRGTLSRDYLEVINLAGSDDMFFPEQKSSANQPSTAK
jgi:hypothetical protein